MTFLESLASGMAHENDEPAAVGPREAFRANSHVPELLLQADSPPMPPHYGPGSPEEAIVCAEELRPAFAQTEGALDWMAAELRQREKEVAARRKEQRRKQRGQKKRRKGR